MTLTAPAPVDVRLYLRGRLYHWWSGLRVVFRVSPAEITADGSVAIQVWNPSLTVLQAILGQTTSEYSVDVLVHGEILISQFPLSQILRIREGESWAVEMRGSMRLPSGRIEIAASESQTVRQVLTEAASQLDLQLELFSTFSTTLRNFQFSGTLTELRKVLALPRVQFTAGSKLSIGPAPVRYRTTALPIGLPNTLTTHTEQDFALDSRITLYTEIDGHGQPLGIIHSGDSTRSRLVTRCQFAP